MKKLFPTVGVIFLATFSAGCGGSDIASTARADIQRQVEKSVPAFAACHRATKSRAASISMSFEVLQKTGSFSRVRVKGGEKALAGCIGKHLRTLQISTPEQVTILVEKYSLRFTKPQQVE